MSEKQTYPLFGKDIIYVCQNESCGSKEKEFALVDRQYKYCSKCGALSIKSTLCDSYQHIPVLHATKSDESYE